MSDVHLLDKTRRIGNLLHNNNCDKVIFSDICSIMQEMLHSNVLVISRKGKILGRSEKKDGKDQGLIKTQVGSFLDPILNERLLSVLSTKEDVNLTMLGFDSLDVEKMSAIITPIQIAGERLGTLFLHRMGGGYGIDDIILCEYATTVVGLEMLRSVSEENAEEDRKLAVVRAAFGTLSFSETEAVILVLKELNGREGLLVASKIADQAGITRSVIVNALRKLESAGILESRSSGMKGTYIRVQNEFVFDEVKKIEVKKLEKSLA